MMGWFLLRLLELLGWLLVAVGRWLSLVFCGGHLDDATRVLEVSVSSSAFCYIRVHHISLSTSQITAKNLGGHLCWYLRWSLWGNLIRHLWGHLWGWRRRNSTLLITSGSLIHWLLRSSYFFSWIHIRWLLLFGVIWGNILSGWLSVKFRVLISHLIVSFHSWLFLHFGSEHRLSVWGWSFLPSLSSLLVMGVLDWGWGWQFR